MKKTNVVTTPGFFISIKVLVVSIFMALCFRYEAKADIVIAADAIYFNSALTSASSAASGGLTFYDLSLFVNPLNSARVYLGATFLGLSTTDTDISSVLTSFASQDIALSMRTYLDRSKSSSLTFGYSFYSKGTFVTGSGSTETWTGTSILVNLSYMPRLRDNFNFGISLTYYGGSYARRIVNTTTDAISAKKTVIIPTLCMEYEF